MRCCVCCKASRVTSFQIYCRLPKSPSLRAENRGILRETISCRLLPLSGRNNFGEADYRVELLNFASFLADSRLTILIDNVLFVLLLYLVQVARRLCVAWNIFISFVTVEIRGTLLKICESCISIFVKELIVVITLSSSWSEYIIK